MSSLQHDSSPTDSTLASRIRAERGRVGWTQGKLAEALGTTQQTVARWESGAKPQKRFFARLGKFLHMSEERVERLANDRPLRLVPDFTSGGNEQRGIAATELLVEAMSERFRTGVPLTADEVDLAKLLLEAARGSGSTTQTHTDPLLGNQ